MGRMRFLKTSAVATVATVAVVAGLVVRAQAPPALSADAPVNAVTTEDTATVRDILKSYEAALNASDTGAVMPLYARDGLFMAPYSPSSVGETAVQKAYESTFKAIKLSVKFNVAEIVPIGTDWAFARTNSSGTVTVHATGTKSAEANQELFVFRKDLDGKWKIARYSFSSTNPPSQP